MKRDQEVDAGDARQRREHHAHHHWLPRHRLGRGHELEPFVGTRGTDARDRQQEREARRTGTRQAERAPRGHGDARARSARHQRQRLRAADRERLRPAQAELVPGAAAKAVRQVHQDAEDGERARDEQRVAEIRLDEVCEQQAREPHGNRRHEDLPCQPAVARLPASEHRVDPRDGHDAKLAAEVGQQREQRADVHGDVEGEALVGPAEEMRDEDQVARARDRQELG
jgi:hypothetical protein